MPGEYVRSNRALLVFCASLLSLGIAGCGSTQQSAQRLSETVRQPFSAVEAEQDLSKVGALAIRLWGVSNSHPSEWTLNGTPLASHMWSYAWIPLMPGTHSLRSSYDDGIWGGVAIHTRTITVDPGETVYLLPGTFPRSEYRQVSRSEFVESIDSRGIETRVKPDEPLHAYLPSVERVLVQNCLSDKKQASCERALAQIPAVLIDPDVRVRMVAAFESVDPSAAVAGVTPGLAPASSSRATSLPPEAERDRLMVQIADLFKAGRPAEALPLFSELNALPVPIDPLSDYFWGQSLLASGDRVGASTKISRFLRSINPQSPYYAPALQLVTEIGGST